MRKYERPTRPIAWIYIMLFLIVFWSSVFWLLT